ncbi:MAG TPA: exodeoxyribonuclease VII large subunit [Acidimicrobiia bacterium]|nr:exodeoxyribonuclease VII large subunit [Acidimicrobiaceae bacterium]HIM65821.1 exodeoxyribonuclease VII large subunit [Acidimicrobiia bacterium]
MDTELPVLSVSRLGSLVKDGLAVLFPEEFWVEGQITNLRTPRSGHTYLDLVEPSDEPGRPPVAAFSVVLWKQTKVGIDRTLAEAGDLALGDDLQVRIRASIDFYPPHGRLQLKMTGVDPGFTLGLMAAQRERLLLALATEGILGRNASLALSEPALRIGLVTSIGSAAHADFCTELERSGIAFDLIERDTRVQGDGAAIDIAEGLRIVATYGPDVIALVRGGGSAVDLSVFDAEVVARTIAGLAVPVLTGIGHEIDRSIADEVAHTSYKTPTACAAALVGAARVFADRISALRTAIADHAHRAIDMADRQRTDLAGRTIRAANAVLRHHTDLLAAGQSRLLHTASALPQRHRERLDALGARLRALDPAMVLARGWSITRLSDGTLVRSPRDVSDGDTLVTALADGTVTSVASASGRMTP